MVGRYCDGRTECTAIRAELGQAEATAMASVSQVNRSLERTAPWRKPKAGHKE